MKFPESLEASGLAEAGPADHARNAFATPKKLSRLSAGAGNDNPYQY